MDLIYCQKDIPKWKWRYGFRSSAATGCGWIASFNALKLMGYEAKPEDLIRYYERQLPLIHGNFGTTILAPAGLFRRMRFRVRICPWRRRLDAAAKAADVNILFYRWRRGWRFGSHFVALRYEDGGFTGYNTYNNSKGPDGYGSSLLGFLRRMRYYNPVLISIWKK